MADLVGLSDKPVAEYILDANRDRREIDSLTADRDRWKARAAVWKEAAKDQRHIAGCNEDLADIAREQLAAAEARIAAQLQERIEDMATVQCANERTEQAEARAEGLRTALADVATWLDGQATIELASGAKIANPSAAIWAGRCRVALAASVEEQESVGEVTT